MRKKVIQGSTGKGATMAISFASNTLASTSGLYLSRYQQAVNQSIEKLSSGKKFNSASDSPGETGYINRFRAAIMSYKKLNDNLQDNMSLLQTADNAISGIGGISTILQSLREKTVEAQNTSLTSQDKANLQQEVEDLIDELDRVASSTEFNTKKLLNGETGAKLTSSDSGLAGYATGAVGSSSYYFTDILGATRHELDAGTAPTGTASTAGSDYDYTASLGTTGTFTLSGSATIDGSFDMVFTSGTNFSVYNNSTGVITAAGSVGTQFTVNGLGITIGSDGTYKTDYKYNFSLSAGNTALVSAEEGNRGTGTAISGASWGSDAMLNSYFDIQFQYDGGSMKYAAFDQDGNRMGSWVASGSKFTAYDSSQLNGSSFTFSATNAGVGDIWRVQFANYDSLQSAGGTLVVSNADSSFSVSYTGADRLSDIVSQINENGAGIATAELDTSTGSSILKIYAADYGEEPRLSTYDSTGNLVSALGLAEKSGTGTDASLKYNSKAYTSADGYFYNVADNVVFEAANDADISSGYVSVSDTSLSQAMNANGPDGITIFIRDLTAQGLGLTRADGTYSMDVTTSSGAESAQLLVDSAINTADGVAAEIGSLVNSLDSHTSYIQSMYTDYQSNLSLHEDTDFAEETTNYYAASAARDTAAAMTAQANLQPQRVLQLLGIIAGQ